MANLKKCFLLASEQKGLKMANCKHSSQSLPEFTAFYPYLIVE
jgi:hypothetical protein